MVTVSDYGYDVGNALPGRTTLFFDKMTRESKQQPRWWHGPGITILEDNTFPEEFLSLRFLSTSSSLCFYLVLRAVVLTFPNPAAIPEVLAFLSMKFVLPANACHSHNMDD